jgi:3-oxoacyl-[acyl-carrier protein] reductase
MDLNLKDKVVLVTAASRGLGAAAARRFAEEGARVAISSRSQDRITQTAGVIAQQTGASLLPIAGDVSEPADADRMVQAVIDRWGRIDILVTNASGPTPGQFLTLKWENWEAAARLTLLSAVRLCQAAIPYMLKNDPPQRGSIVAITSYTVKQPADGLLLSNSLRLGVIGLVKTLANELGAQGIRVNAIAPGWTKTERVDEILASRAQRNGTTAEQEAARQIAEIPMGRMGIPDEFADALVWLASPRASFVHGITLSVDGGIVKSAL